MILTPVPYFLAVRWALPPSRWLHQFSRNLRVAQATLAGLAIDYLNSLIADGDQGDLLIALRQMTKAYGGVTAIAEKANLNPTQLYRTLSAESNPGLSGLSSILNAMGLRLAVEPIKAKRTAHARRWGAGGSD